jgi:hypothetical protein
MSREKDDTGLGRILKGVVNHPAPFSCWLQETDHATETCSENMAKIRRSVGNLQPITRTCSYTSVYNLLLPHRLRECVLLITGPTGGGSCLEIELMFPWVP